jgi:hypothetical protein
MSAAGTGAPASNESPSRDAGTARLELAAGAASDLGAPGARSAAFGAGPDAGWTSGDGGSELILTGRERSLRGERPPSSMRVRRRPLGRAGSAVGIIGTEETSNPWV